MTAARSTEEYAGPTTTLRGPPVTILVADDDALTRRLVSIGLRDAGYDVTEAADGAEALELAVAGTFSAVVLDNYMPAMSGVEVIRELRSRAATATLPVILVTAADAVADRVAGLYAGADDYVTKPFSLDEIVARVSAHVRARQAWQDTIAAHARQRTALAQTLSMAGRQTGLESTAKVLCSGLAGQADIRSVCVLRFTADGLVVPIACHGPTLWGLAPGDPVPPSLRRYLHSRAVSGPWWERGDSTGTPTPALVASAPTACVPMRDDVGVRGLVLLAFDVNSGVDAASALGAAIDFGAVAHGLLRRLLDEQHATEAGRMELQWVLRDRAYTPHYQPIVDLSNGATVGVEALTRFTDGSSPETRFREAALIGLGLDLEVATLASAVYAAAGVEPRTAWLSLNVSPALVMRDPVGLRAALDAGGDRPLVLELSEQEAVTDYDAMRRAVGEIGAGIRLSIDDAGSGFASLRHILRLEPAFIKLDRSWVRGVEDDPARQALIAGLRHFADQTGAALIAEGIERVEERDILIDLRVEFGQGFLLGRPAAIT